VCITKPTHQLKKVVVYLIDIKEETLMKNYIPTLKKDVAELVCDTCGLQATIKELEFNEFICINHPCSYGTIHDDGKQMQIDLCQQCFADMCGDSLRFIDENQLKWKGGFEYGRADVSYL
jgi:hypothetical protein